MSVSLLISPKITRVWIVHLQGTRCKAVVNRCKPLITKQIDYHRLSQMANKMGFV